MMVNAIPSPYEIPSINDLRRIGFIISEVNLWGRGKHRAGMDLAEILKRALGDHLGESIPSSDFALVASDYTTLRMVLAYRRSNGRRGTLLVTVVGQDVIVLDAVHPFATTIEQALLGPMPAG